MGESYAPCDVPQHRGCWGHQMPPMLFFNNLVKKLDNLSTSNIDIYPSTLEMCINNLLKLFSLDLDHPTPPENHTYAQYFQQNPTHLLTVNV